MTIRHVLKTMLPLLFATQVWSQSMTFDELRGHFDRDMGRFTPAQLTEQYQSLIGRLTGITEQKPVEIIHKTRGELKQEVRNSYQSLTNKDKDGLHFILQQHGLIEPDAVYDEHLYEPYFDSIGGLYDSIHKQLILVEDIDQSSLQTVLLHELVHNAQDSVVDLNKIINQQAKTFDQQLASRALVEGQAEAINILPFLLESDDPDALKKILNRLDTILDSNQNPENESSIGLSTLYQFPYFYGMRFVLQRYVQDRNIGYATMFQKIPRSTEQILYSEKFLKDERPSITRAEKQTQHLSQLPDLKLIYHTTLGAFYINELTKTPTTNLSKGWSGDHILVFQHQNSFLTVWDLIWDTKKQAKQFAQHKRWHIQSTIAETKKPNTDVILTDRRVVLFDGNWPESLKRNVSKAIGLGR